MKILVTGGAGYIGSHTCVELLNEAYEVVVLDNLSNSSEESLNRVRRITGRPLAFYKTDLLDKKATAAVFADHQIDAVIHFAGLKAVGESVLIPLKYFHNNITGTLNLLEVMGEAGVKNLVFSSSATVYGDETWDIALLRYFNPVGAHSSGDIGEDPAGIPNNLMPYISRVAVGSLPEVNVFGDDYPTPDGTGVRDFIHVVDLAQGHIKTLPKLFTRPGIVTYNLGTGRGYSVLDMIKGFEDAGGKKIPYKIGPRRAGDVAACWADPSKAYDELGWKAQKSLDDMCRDTWRWQRKNPNGFRKNCREK